MKLAPKRTRLRLDALVPHPKNPRTHPQIQISALAESVKRFGQPRPILVRSANKQIISGHGLSAAMRIAGETEADCLVWDVDQKTADEYLIADNRLAELGHTDEDLLRELLGDIDADAYGALGFADDEVEALLQEKGDHDILVKEIETEEVRDEFWISVTGSLKHQALALQRLQELMAELDVKVEIGTTPR